MIRKKTLTETDSVVESSLTSWVNDKDEDDENHGFTITHSEDGTMDLIEGDINLIQCH